MSLRLTLISAFVIAGCTFQILSATAQEADKAPAPKDPIGYFLGISMGQQMNQSGFRLGDFDLESLKAGFVDGLAKKDAVLTPEQLREAEGEIQALLSRRHEERLAEKKAEGDAWLKENAKKEGIKTLAQGLQYKVLKSGNGKSPARTDTVRVHYTGKLTNGQVFDSSVQRGQPAEFGVGQVIAGWTMALQKMKVGDKWMLYIPSELAYGERGSRGAIGPNEVLIFEVELLDIL